MTARLGRGSRTVTVFIGTMLAAVAGLVVAGTAAAQPPPPGGPKGPVIVCTNPDPAAPRPVPPGVAPGECTDPDPAAPRPVPPGVAPGECTPGAAGPVVIAPDQPAEPKSQIAGGPDGPDGRQLCIERR